MNWNKDLKYRYGQMYQRLNLSLIVYFKTTIHDLF